MGRFIDADALKIEFKRWQADTLDFRTINDVIDGAQTIDAIIACHGELTKDKDVYLDGTCVACTACGTEWYAPGTSADDIDWDYCPSCGCKFDAQELKRGVNNGR